jgi:small subunit ribosomal protein S6
LAASVYECMLLLDSNKYNNDGAGVIGQIHGLIQKHHAEVLASRPWDERRLAYPVAGHKKGTFYLLYFRGEGRNLKGLESDFNLNEVILRQLMVRIDPKLVDTMLALARDEHAFAIQAPGLAEDSTNGVPLPRSNSRE